MAVVSGTVHSVETIKAADRDVLQAAIVYFTLSGTYAQADNAILSGVPTLIQNSRRNGRMQAAAAASRKTTPATIANPCQVSRMPAPDTNQTMRSPTNIGAAPPAPVVPSMTARASLWRCFRLAIHRPARSWRTPIVCERTCGCKCRPENGDPALDLRR